MTLSKPVILHPYPNSKRLQGLILSQSVRNILMFHQSQGGKEKDCRIQIQMIIKPVQWQVGGKKQLFWIQYLTKIHPVPSQVDCNAVC
jgi:hypothetical protein